MSALLETVSGDWLAVKPFQTIQVERPDVDLASTGREETSTIFEDVGWDTNDSCLSFVAYIPGVCQENSSCSIVSKTAIDSHKMTLTIDDLKRCHEQAAMLQPSLTGSLPELPVLRTGIMSFISSPVVPEDLDVHLLEYLQFSFHCLGKALFADIFLRKQVSDDVDYFENLEELNRVALVAEVSGAKKMLDEILTLRESSISIDDMVSLYDMEDEAQSSVDVAKAVVYNFDRQSFLDMREVAHQECKRLSKLLHANPEEQDAAKVVEFSKWKLCFSENASNLLDLDIQFLGNSVAALQDAVDRLHEDQQRFGAVEFSNSPAKKRLERKSKELVILGVQELLLKRKKASKICRSIRQQVLNLEDDDKLTESLKKLEKQYFDSQMKVYDVTLALLDKEEAKCRRKLKEFLVGDNQDAYNEYFYDACEEQDFNVKGSQEFSQKQELVNELNGVFSKRAAIRNRKRLLMKDFDSKKSKRMSIEENYNQHHAIQLKRDARRKELAEKEEFLKLERRKTLQRLKGFKKRYPEPVAKLPPRYITSSRVGAGLPPFRPAGCNASTLMACGRQEEVNRRISNSTQKIERDTQDDRATLPSNSDCCQDVLPSSEDVAPQLSSISAPPPTPPPPPPPPPPTCPPPVPPPPPFVASASPHKTTSCKSKPTSKADGSQPPIGDGCSQTFDLSSILNARQKLRHDRTFDSKDLVASAADDRAICLDDVIRQRAMLRKAQNRDVAVSDIAAVLLRNTLLKMRRHTGDEEAEPDDVWAAD